MKTFLSLAAVLCLALLIPAAAVADSAATGEVLDLATLDAPSEIADLSPESGTAVATDLPYQPEWLAGGASLEAVGSCSDELYDCINDCPNAGCAWGCVKEWVSCDSE